MIILGIETSCDETALALLETRGHGAPAGRRIECRVISSLVHSQADLHSPYGGVFPSLAKREHGKNLVPLLHKLLTEAEREEALKSTTSARPSRRVSFSPTHGNRHSDIERGSAPKASSEPLPVPLEDILEQFRAEVAPQNPELFESFAAADFLKDAPPMIDKIAVTEGPGLEPTLWVGINFARMLAALWKAPIVPVDHMEGHIVGSLLAPEAMDGAWHGLHEAPMPAVALLIIGGHTELVEVRKIGDYKVIGKTRDDAVGEAFDKAARLIGLPYPGGPHIEELSQLARAENLEPPVKLPRPMVNSGNLDFSFSGLKTAVLYAVRAAPKDRGGVLSDEWKKGLAREFEQAVVETLEAKLRSAVEKTGARSIIVGGGVSANRSLQENFKKIAAENGIPLFLPTQHVSGDNALMIALAGAMHDETRAPGKIRAHGTKSL